MSDPLDPVRRPDWGGLFREAAEPVFLLSRKRAVRFVNPAWERLTGLMAADVYHRICSRRQSEFPALRAMAPPADTHGPITVRRSVPPTRGGPPWPTGLPQDRVAPSGAPGRSPFSA